MQTIDKMNLQYKTLIIFSMTALILTCGLARANEITEDKAYQLVEKMVKKVGDYKTLQKKKDVIYSYSYITPDGKYDQSIEKYIFDGELSYGEYITHQRTFNDLKGTIEQGYDGSEYWLKHKGEIIDNENRLKRVAFNRPTNFYWFTMMQKLLDPGLKYEYLGEVKDGNYDIVKVSFESQSGKPTDIYQLYINKKTSLVDHFLFTVADFNLVEVPFIMVLDYEKIDGLYIPTKRKYKKSTWDAKITKDPWIEVKWTNIRFNNNLSKEEFNKGYKMEGKNTIMSFNNLKN